jgi:hypothetical protein
MVDHLAAGPLPSQCILSSFAGRHDIPGPLVVISYWVMTMSVTELLTSKR